LIKYQNYNNKKIFCIISFIRIKKLIYTIQMDLVGHIILALRGQ
jgi:hypothetical protein